MSTALQEARRPGARRSIQRRLLLAFLGLAVAPLLLAGLTNAVLYYRQYTEAELKHLQELSRRVAIQAEDVLRQGERALGTLLLYRNLPRLAPAEQERLLAELLARHDFIQEAALLDRIGRERARRSAVEVVLALRDRHTEELFRRPFASGQVYYGPIHYDASGEPRLAVALPLRDLTTDRIEAVLSAELRLKALWDLVARLVPEAGTQVYVLDEQGLVVAHRNPSVVLRGTRVDLAPGPAVTRGLARGEVFLADSAMRVGQRVFRVVAERDWWSAVAPALDNLLVLAGVLLLALLVAFAAGAQGLRRIVRPIVSVEGTARAIAAGELGRRVAVESDDEIGDLARSFNAMTDHLQRTLTALQAEVSVRQQAEQALRESEARYRLLVENQNDLIVKFDPAGRLSFVSPSYCQTFGKHPAELLGRSFMPLIHQDDRPQVAASLQRLLRTPHTTSHEERALTAAGWRWLAWSNRAVLDAQGAVCEIIAVGRDITERKEMELELVRHREHLEALVAERAAALQESELRYRTVANFTTDWETWRGEDGTYRYISPSCERITGYTADEFAADPDLLLRLLHPEDREHFEQHLHRNREAQQQERLEFRLVRRDGSTVWIEHICQPIYDEDGHYLGTRASNRDVTDHKRQARELAQARDQAEAANCAKSVFLANMSHELRTPMNAILGFSQLMLRDTGLTGEQRENIETIQRSGEHLLALINDVLEISKIEAGRMKVELTVFDLRGLLVSLEEMNRIRAEKKALEFRVDCAPDLPGFVRGDAKKLRQILLNLLSNAIKFTDEGQVALHVARCRDAPPDCIEFTVMDTGCGIPPGDRERIFEAFYQTPESARRGEGTGLGLSISREYARLMNGEIGVESQEGRGSTFRVRLPLPQAPKEAIADHAGSRQVRALTPGQQTFRILIVEDKVDNRRLLMRLLKSVGFDVREALNGAEALTVFHAWRPHFIWMDMRMPVMDGYEATRRIKATPEGRGTVIVALTASAFEEDRAEVLAAGCDDFLRKPVAPKDVYDTLHKYLGVEYVYADDSMSATVQPSPQALSHERLSALPDALRAGLRESALALDTQRMREVIGRIREIDVDLAATLEEIADGYRYDELLRLSEP